MKPIQRFLVWLMSETNAISNGCAGWISNSLSDFLIGVAANGPSIALRGLGMCEPVSVAMAVTAALSAIASYQSQASSEELQALQLDALQAAGTAQASGANNAVMMDIFRNKARASGQIKSNLAWEQE